MGGGGGGGAGDYKDYIPIANCHHQNDPCIKMDTTRMTPALRWAAMRTILMFHSLRGTKSQEKCPQTTTFRNRKESRSGIEPKPLCLPA